MRCAGVCGGWRRNEFFSSFNRFLPRGVVMMETGFNYSEKGLTPFFPSSFPPSRYHSFIFNPLSITEIM